MKKYEVPQKLHRLKESVYKSRQKLHWFHDQGFGCIVCGNTSIQAHHLDTGGGNRGDDRIVPLCLLHHTGDSFSAHGSNSKEFYEQYPKDEFFGVIADKIHKQYRWEHNE